MNDEIKEILLIIKSCKQDYDKQKNGMHTFDYGELYLLFNYITNLQQSDTDKQLEIMKLKGRLEKQRKEYQDTYKDVRIEIKEKNDTITNLQQENDKLLNENIVIKDVKYMVDEAIYKSRCEKGIETIDNMISNGWILEQVGTVMGYSPAKKCCKVRLERIKNILQNGSDEE